MKTVLLIAAAVVSYLLGSVSFSVILTKKKYNRDVREAGSGNAGATNVARVFGFKAGLITLLCDVAKCAASMLIGMLIWGDIGIAVCGIACTVGHCFPAFFQFRGGKGVSVALAVTIFISWKVCLICIAVFVIFVLLTKIVSISSCFAATALIISTALIGFGTPKLLLALIVGVLVIFMHRTNLVRLAKGEEKQFSFKK